MNNIKDLLPQVHSPPKEQKIDIEYEYQQLGLEMQAHFGKDHRSKIWPLFHSPRYNISIIRESWFVYLKTGKTSFRYFMGILINKAGLKK